MGRSDVLYVFLFPLLLLFSSLLFLCGFYKMSFIPFASIPLRMNVSY